MQFIQGIGGMLFGQEVSKRFQKPGSCNLFNDSYTEIHEDNTAIIDQMIMEPANGIPGPVIISSGTKMTPAVGQHQYRLKPEETDPVGTEDLCYVSLIKFIEGSGREKRTYYVVWEPRFDYMMIPIFWTKGKSPIDRFRALLKNRERGSLITYRIDSTSWMPSLFSLSVDHPTEMKAHQSEALRFVIEQYRRTQRGTFLFSGTRGTGKTTTALQLKRELEDEYPNTSVTLIPNFNPSQTSVDINKLALRDINASCPYVIVVNEIESHMQIAASDPVDKAQHGDRRFTHSADRTSFHDMLDTFAATKYLIVVLATEKSVEELWENKDYRSFIRSGRVHGMVCMTHTTSTVEVNKLRDDVAPDPCTLIDL